MSIKTRDISDYLDDISNAINEADEFIRDMSYETFASDRKTVNAVIRSLEVLGEATKRIPASFRQKHPDIPWSKMKDEHDVWHPQQTRSLRSCGCIRSREPSELLLTQKTKLPCLHDGLLKENPDTER
jgi:hypothetical protein